MDLTDDSGDLTNLTAKELSARMWLNELPPGSEQYEIRRRMERLEKCEAEWYEHRCEHTPVFCELKERLEKCETQFARVEKANMPCRKHKPLRSPLCRQCQLDARIEEARAAVEGK